jgi:hypothetical protein
MMIGKMEIINVALARLGESPIQSLEEGSVPANVAKQMYDVARTAALRDYNWAFASKIATLARLDVTPVDFRFAFALPSGCLRVAGLRGGAPYTLRGDVLYADCENAVIEYTEDVVDTVRYDSKFVEALTYKLASELAMPIKGSADLMNYYREAYEATIRQAATYSAREGKTYLPENPYLEARNSWQS